eukprot:366406-Chlamydomonas_euryale.AAC.22
MPYTVFRVSRYSGTPSETEEMRPAWFPETSPPFDCMWADDPHWYPHFLMGSGKKLFAGVFGFTCTTTLVWHTMRCGLSSDDLASGAMAAASWRQQLCSSSADVAVTLAARPHNIAVNR